MTKKLPKAQRIQQILDAAIKEFNEKGFDGASMDSIAQRAQLTKGGLYHHFKGKREILIAANDKLMEPVYDLMNQANQSESPLSGIRLYIRKSLDHWAQNPDAIVFSFVSMSKMVEIPVFHDGLLSYVKILRHFFKNLFDSGVKKGEFIDHDTESRALTLQAALDGFSTSLLAMEKADPSHLSAHFEEVFLSDIVCQKSENVL